MIHLTAEAETNKLRMGETLLNLLELNLESRTFKTRHCIHEYFLIMHNLLKEFSLNFFISWFQTITNFIAN